LILEITPRMIAAFLLAGWSQAIVPQEMMSDGWGMARDSKAFNRYDLGGITPGGR